MLHRTRDLSLVDRSARIPVRPAQLCLAVASIDLQQHFQHLDQQYYGHRRHDHCLAATAGCYLANAVAIVPEQPRVEPVPVCMQPS